MTASLRLEIHEKTGKARWVQVIASEGAEVPKGSSWLGLCGHGEKGAYSRATWLVHAYCVLPSRILPPIQSTVPPHWSHTSASHTPPLRGPYGLHCIDKEKARVNHPGDGHPGAAVPKQGSEIQM